MASKKVMIVDDDKEFLYELEEALVLSGYDLVAVNDSLSALHIAAKITPDVILLDLRMPGKSGFQLADEIRRFSGLEDTPIIAMSGLFKDEYIPFLKMCGIKKCLKKPFNPLDVIAEIEVALK